MKVAIVHDWLTVNGGAEKVTRDIVALWPDADVFSLIDFLSKEDRQEIVNGKKVHTSFIQRMPFAKSSYRSYLPFFPFAIEQFDLSAYDLVISSSYSVAKGVLTNYRQTHVCYCHTPMRYAWDLYHHYLDESGLSQGPRSLLARFFLHRIRLWDGSNTNRVDHFVANSKNVAKRIRKIYQRDSTVIYPPVDAEQFQLHEEKEDFFLVVSRLVPYKKVDLIVDAFREIPNQRLVVVGNGTELKKIENRATPNIEVLGYQPFEQVTHYMQRAKALVLAAEEDFGITSLEAQLCGTPVIAYGKGGYLETVVDGVTGTFFEEQTIEAVKQAVEQFSSIDTLDSAENIRQHALRFDRENFRTQFGKFVHEKLEGHG